MKLWNWIQKSNHRHNENNIIECAGNAGVKGMDEGEVVSTLNTQQNLQARFCIYKKRSAYSIQYTVNANGASVKTKRKYSNKYKICFNHSHFDTNNHHQA